MDKFTELTGVAAPLPIINLDTDKIFPAIYLKTIKRTGLSQWLFQEIRFRPDGSENPDFVLNQAPYRNAKILIGADNFGCGSSREHAPGRCSISASAASSRRALPTSSITTASRTASCRSRCQKRSVDELMEDAKKGANAVMTIDLETQTITRPDGEKVHFEVDAFRKHCLLNGLDDIGLTEQKGAEIASYEEKARLARPWQFGMTHTGA